MKESNSNRDAIEKLAKLVTNSDKEAFNALFELLWEPMFVYAASIVMDNSLAKDLVQEVWMDYWQRREEMEIRNLKPYLYKAIRYRCYNTIRNTKFNQTQIDSANTVYIPSEIELEENAVALSKQIDATISGLPKRSQEVFRLSRINDFNNKEIAEKLNISQRSVENHISLALRKLRKELSIVKFLSF